MAEAEPEPEAEPVAEPEPAVVAEPSPRVGFFARLRGRLTGRPGALEAVVVAPPPRTAGTAAEAEAHGAEARGGSAEARGGGPRPRARASAPQPRAASAPPSPPTPPEVQRSGNHQAALKAALDSLGQAHHRPFSRG